MTIDLRNFRIDPAWPECVPTMPTVTPGMFYHGSPETGIRRFVTGSGGIYFTHSPSHAAYACAARANGYGGRVYRAEIITTNPAFDDEAVWYPDGGGSRPRDFELARCAEAREAGHDAIVVIQADDTIHEIIVLDSNAVRSRESVGKVKSWKSATAFERLVFYEVEDAEGPDFAPGCRLLFGNRRRAGTTPIRRVLVNATNPLYCDKAAWPRFDYDVLRHIQADCLIDPTTRDALLIDVFAAMPVEGWELRAIRKNARRQAKGGAR